MANRPKKDFSPTTFRVPSMVTVVSPAGAPCRDGQGDVPQKHPRPVQHGKEHKAHHQHRNQATQNLPPAPPGFLPGLTDQQDNGPAHRHLRLRCIRLLSPQQVQHLYTQGIRQGLQEGDVRKPSAPFPFAHCPVRDVELRRQFLLGQAPFLAGACNETSCLFPVHGHHLRFQYPTQSRSTQQTLRGAAHFTPIPRTPDPAQSNNGGQRGSQLRQQQRRPGQLLPGQVLCQHQSQSLHRGTLLQRVHCHPPSQENLCTIPLQLA